MDFFSKSNGTEYTEICVNIYERKNGSGKVSDDCERARQKCMDCIHSICGREVEEKNFPDFVFSIYYTSDTNLVCPSISSGISEIVPYGSTNQKLRRKITSIKLVILALRRDQLIVGTSLDDPSLLHDHDTVGVLDGGETVGDDESGPSFHEGIHAVLYQFFGTGVDGGSSLIENQRRRVGHGRPCDGEKLALSLA